MLVSMKGQASTRDFSHHHSAGAAIEDPIAPARDFHRYCFACGVSNTQGLSLHFEVDAQGVARAVWQPSSRFESYPGRVHGGVVATLLDSAMVHALFARGIKGVTAEMTIRYLKPVPLSQPIEVCGIVNSSRHGLHQCTAEVRQDASLVVRASAKFFPMPEGNQ